MMCAGTFGDLKQESGPGACEHPGVGAGTKLASSGRATGALNL